MDLCKQSEESALSKRAFTQILCSIYLMLQVSVFCSSRPIRLFASFPTFSFCFYTAVICSLMVFILFLFLLFRSDEDFETFAVVIYDNGEGFKRLSEQLKAGLKHERVTWNSSDHWINIRRWSRSLMVPIFLSPSTIRRTRINRMRF